MPRLFLLMPMLLFVAFGVARAEDEAGSTASSPTHQKGIFYGKILSIGPEFEYFFVQGFEKRLGRRTFYLNPRTYFWRERKRIVRTTLKVGDMVSLRYFGEKNVWVAEDVFLVEGKYNHRQYLNRPRPAVPGQKKEPEKPKAAEGAEKPAADAKPAAGGGH